jgi:glutaryl-CoA dehydrogenase
MGAARDCYESALAYAKEREQFGRPIASFQLVQEKLANMLIEVGKGTLLALHIGRMKDAGTLKPEHISFGKLNNVREAIEIAREARTVFGGNGVTLDYPPMRHMSNLESVRTYEGTDEVHTLILGGAITGITRPTRNRAQRLTVNEILRDGSTNGADEGDPGRGVWRGRRAPLRRRGASRTGRG